MKIQFLNPSVCWYSNFQYRMLPTLSLPILSAVFRRAGHESEVVDLEALAVSPDALREAFIKQRDHWPDVVGVTSLTLTQRGAQATIKALRDAGFDRPIVAGGVHLTMYPQDGLDWGADLVVRGECEGNIVELVESGARGIVDGVPAAIEDIPLPDWDHHNPRVTTYHANMPMLRPFPSVAQFARGCPFRCIFCSNIIFGGQKTRYRPAEHVIAEMRDLAARGARHCYVYDDELVGTAQPDGWMNEIADGIQGLGIKWLTQGRCSQKHITLDLLKDMKRAGCFYIFWGVESFSQKVLDTMHKGTKVADIWHSLRMAKEAGIKNGTLTMVGNYGETEEDLAITAQALGEADREGLVQYRQTTICTPMPGTELARRAQAEGWYKEPPDKGEQMLQVLGGTPWVSAERLRWWLLEFHRVCTLGEFGQP